MKNSSRESLGLDDNYATRDVAGISHIVGEPSLEEHPLKTKSPKSRNMEMDATIIHIVDETNNAAIDSHMMDNS